MNENHSEHLIGYSAKAKTHYTSFSVASPRQVQKSVVSVVSCYFLNSITMTQQTCCQLVANLLATPWHVKIVCHVANKSTTSWQLLSLRRSYREMSLMDFGHRPPATDIC